MGSRFGAAASANELLVGVNLQKEEVNAAALYRLKEPLGQMGTQ